MNFGAPGTLERINGWCADKTNNKIETIVDEVSNKILMILANAVYFKGIWTSQFQKDDTREATFNSESGPTTVQMMQQTDYFAYTTNEHAAWLALPYGNKAFEMIVILPHNNTVDGIIDNLNRKSWVEITESMQPRSVKLSLPRFKSECEYYLEESILPAMGMKIPFTYLSADFSGISDSAPCISTVIHKTFVEVNEEGTEAAAVTGVVFEMSYTEPTVFNVNKPFLFAIRERSTGGILFIGKMGVIEN